MVAIVGNILSLSTQKNCTPSYLLRNVCTLYFDPLTCGICFYMTIHDGKIQNVNLQIIKISPYLTIKSLRKLLRLWVGRKHR